MEINIQKNIWDSVQVNRITGGDFKANIRRLNKILTIVEKLDRGHASDIKILNIGIGNAYMEKFLLAKHYDIFTLDPSESAIDTVQELLGLDDEHAKCGWSQDIPYSDDTFNFIIMSEVIEHLSDEILEPTFKELQRVLIHGGFLIGSVPDNEDLGRNQFRCPYCSKISHRVGHERTLTRKSLRELLIGYFHVISLFSFRGMYLNYLGVMYFHWIDFPFRIARLFGSNVRSPHQISFNLMFVARNTMEP